MVSRYKHKVFVWLEMTLRNLSTHFVHIFSNHISKITIKKYRYTISIVMFGLYFFWICKDPGSAITFIAAAITCYVALYAIAWAKYEFHITRQSQQMSILVALCATDKRKSFAPALAAMTNKKLPKYPTIFKINLIFSSLSSLNNKNYITETNIDTLESVKNIIFGFYDWEKVDLSNINFKNNAISNITLKESNLSYANFKGSILYKIILNNSDLQYSNFKKSQIYESDLTKSKLENTNFEKCRLERSDLCKASMKKINLEHAFIFGTGMSEADLSNANLKECKFHDVFLYNSKLNNANLEKTQFIRSNLSYTSLLKVIFSETNLQGSILENANLSSFYIKIGDEYISTEDIGDDKKIIYSIVEILSKAHTLYGAELPDPIKTIMVRDYPDLFHHHAQ